MVSAFNDYSRWSDCLSSVYSDQSKSNSKGYKKWLEENDRRDGVFELKNEEKSQEFLIGDFLILWNILRSKYWTGKLTLIKIK